MKKMFIGLFALVAGLAVFAFTNSNEVKAKTVTNTYWFPTDANGNVTSTTVSTSATTQPCSGGDEVFCALGYPEGSQYISVQGNMVTLNDPSPLDHGIQAKRDE